MIRYSKFPRLTFVAAFALTLFASSPAFAQALRQSGLQRPAVVLSPSVVTWQDGGKRSTLRPVLIGALIGAVAGTAVLYATYDCGSTGSMCGLGIPLFGGAGALIGGGAGYVWSRLR